MAARGWLHSIIMPKNKTKTRPFLIVIVVVHRENPYIPWLDAGKSLVRGIPNDHYHTLHV